jgi:hypothetical protein
MCTAATRAGDVEAGKHKEALEGFLNVVKMEEEKSEWCVGVRSTECTTDGQSEPCSLIAIAQNVI